MASRNDIIDAAREAVEITFVSLKTAVRQTTDPADKNKNAGFVETAGGRIEMLAGDQFTAAIFKELIKLKEKGNVSDS